MEVQETLQSIDSILKDVLSKDAVNLLIFLKKNTFKKDLKMVRLSLLKIE